MRVSTTTKTPTMTIKQRLQHKKKFDIFVQ